MNNKIIFPFFSHDGICEFTIWAPKAKIMFLEILENQSVKKVKMDPQDRGYWSASMKDIKTGTRYKYNIDNKNSFPDPASLSQPDGVHGYSEVIDIKNFKWEDDTWQNIPLKNMIQYEIHTGTFSPESNFDGIASRLDHLIDLGINAIEILPVSQFSGHRNWGYDGVYPFAVQNTYDGAFELMKLVNLCHKKGIAVIMDVVYNHFGPEGNYVSQFGHYFSGNYSTPWGKPINFDGPHSDEVRNFFIQNAIMWIRDFHIDALRLDAVHAIYDFSAKHIMQELAENLNYVDIEMRKPSFLIAESNANDVRYITSITNGGYGLDAMWSDDFHHSLHALVTNERDGYYVDFGKTEHLARSIKYAHLFDGKYSHYRQKTYGKKTAYNTGDQFVIFNQNHDQVGNRKMGERLISLTGFETAKLCAGATLTAPNVPMLFMGEEYAERNPFYYFISHLDKKLNKLVKEGRQREFEAFYNNAGNTPDPASPETFKQSCLSWDIKQSPEKSAMFNYYKALIHLRKTNPVLRTTDKKNIDVQCKGKMLIVQRWQQDMKVLIFMNFENTDHSIVNPMHEDKMFKKVLDSADEKWNGPGSRAPVEVRQNSEIIVMKNSMLIYLNT